MCHVFVVCGCRYGVCVGIYCACGLYSIIVYCVCCVVCLYTHTTSIHLIIYIHLHNCIVYAYFVPISLHLLRRTIYIFRHTTPPCSQNLFCPCPRGTVCTSLKSGKPLKTSFSMRKKYNAHVLEYMYTCMRLV